MRDRIRKILREEEDFDWISKPNKATENYIGAHLLKSDLYPNSDAYKMLLNTILSLGLTEGQVDNLSQALIRGFHQVRESGFESGSQAGWESGHESGYDEGNQDSYDRGYEEGYDEAEAEYRYTKDEDLDAKYDEGYDEGREEGYEKGYSEGAEETYYEAFEEGRKYQSNMEEEEYERRQDPFNRENEEY